jgi:hypothetical protein
VPAFRALAARGWHTSLARHTASFPRPVSLDVYLLGIVGFDSFVVLQDRLADELIGNDCGGIGANGT